MSDPVKAIVHRLRRCTPDGVALTLDHAESVAWHSLLFDGGRHRLSLRLGGDAIDDAVRALRAEVAGEDFTIPGHLVAQIRIDAVDRDPETARIALDALTVANDPAPPLETETASRRRKRREPGASA